MLVVAHGASVVEIYMENVGKTEAQSRFPVFSETFYELELFALFRR